MDLKWVTCKVHCTKKQKILWNNMSNVEQHAEQPCIFFSVMGQPPLETIQLNFQNKKLFRSSALRTLRTSIEVKVTLRQARVTLTPVPRKSLVRSWTLSMPKWQKLSPWPIGTRSPDKSLAACLFVDCVKTNLDVNLKSPHTLWIYAIQLFLNSWIA